MKIQVARGCLLAVLLLLPLSMFGVSVLPSDPMRMSSFVDGLTEARFADFEKRAAAGDAEAQVVVALAISKYADELWLLAWHWPDGKIETADAAVRGLRRKANELFKAAAKAGNRAGVLYAIVPTSAMELVDCQTYETELKSVANSGYPAAMYELGHLYENPRCGVKTEYSLAMVWLRKSSDAGCVLADAKIATLYRDGKGVNEDHAEAFKWFLRAAESGYAPAQNDVGIMLAEADGVKPDPRKAVQWFRKAAEQGNVFAACNLGVHYAGGQGIEKNIRKALFWTAVSDILDDHCHAHEQFFPMLKPDEAEAVVEEAVAWAARDRMKRLGYRQAVKWLRDRGFSLPPYSHPATFILK